MAHFHPLPTQAPGILETIQTLRKITTEKKEAFNCVWHWVGFGGDQINWETLFAAAKDSDDPQVQALANDLTTQLEQYESMNEEGRRAIDWKPFLQKFLQLILALLG